MSVYATSITVYKGRNHTVRIVVDLTTLTSIVGAVLKFSVRAGAVTGDGQKVIYKTNSGGSDLQAAIISEDTVEFYLIPADTVNLVAGNYTADATIQTSLGVFQLLEPTALTLKTPVTI